MEIINKLADKKWTFREIPVGSVFSIVGYDDEPLFFIKIKYDRGFCLHPDGEIEIFSEDEEIIYYPKAKMLIE